MKAENRQFPWLPVTLLIAGLIVGYSFVTITSQTAHAAAGSCPTTHLQN